MTRPTAVVLRTLSAAGPLAAGAWGAAAPQSVLVGGLAWLAFLLAVLAGWGFLVERCLRTRVDLGLRLAWGVAGLLGVAGVGLALGVLSRGPIVALLGVGAAGFVWHRLSEATPVLARVGPLARAAARDPQTAIAWGLLIALAAINILGAVARTHGNPYDDDVAYLPLIRRLLDVGDLDEPFSFRRLSAMGGQTVLGALAAVRGTQANLYLIDHGVCQLVSLALLVGMVRSFTRRDLFVVALALLVVLLLPDASTNTASYWSGFALFLALYRTAVALPALGARGPIALGLVAAACATLRQNFLPVAVLVPALVLAFQLERPLAASWRQHRRTWGLVVLAATVALVPYLVASWRSNETFLYPLWSGTGNPSVPTRAALWTLWDELGFFLRVTLDPNPIRVMLPLAPILLLCRDRRAGRPLLAFTIAAIVGYVLLVHSFSLSDERNLWRYAFGFTAPLALVLMLEVAGRGWRGDDHDDHDDATPVHASPLARLLVIACLLGQFIYSSRTTLANYRARADDVRAAATSTGRAARDAHGPAAYQDLQRAVPAGAALVVMVDDAAELDYARNRILNLDTPGFASYRPGLPMFAGAEAKATYFRAHGLRYLAFVRGDHSRYFYRRDYWLERIFWDAELWRVVAGYQLDMIDSLAELAERYPRLHDRDGLVVVDLGATP